MPVNLSAPDPRTLNAVAGVELGIAQLYQCFAEMLRVVSGALARAFAGAVVGLLINCVVVAHGAGRLAGFVASRLPRRG